MVPSVANLDPNLAYVLLALGILGIYIECSSPGLFLPGALGGILAVVSLYSLFTKPVNWVGAGLMILAIGLFVLEAYMPAKWAWGALGGIAMTAGAILLRVRAATALAVSIPFALITVVLFTVAARARSNKVMVGRQSIVDEIGIAETAIDPTGKVLVRGKFWTATSRSPIAKGTKIRVIAVDGQSIEVDAR